MTPDRGRGQEGSLGCSELPGGDPRGQAGDSGGASGKEGPRDFGPAPVEAGTPGESAGISTPGYIYPGVAEKRLAVGPLSRMRGSAPEAACGTLGGMDVPKAVAGYLSLIGAKGGAAGKGAKKSRGSREHYREMSRKAAAARAANRAARDAKKAAE